MLEILIIIGLLVLAAYLSYSTRNKLKILKKRISTAYTHVDGQLKRRNELIPFLVEAAKGHLEHERETLVDMLRLKEQAMAACHRAAEDPSIEEAIHALNNAEADLRGSLRHFLSVVEYYPSLKASEKMSRLIAGLGTVESRITALHQSFNHSVKDYNSEREKLPNLIVSIPMGFRRAAPLHSPAARAQSTPGGPVPGA